MFLNKGGQECLEVSEWFFINFVGKEMYQQQIMMEMFFYKLSFWAFEQGTMFSYGFYSFLLRSLLINNHLWLTRSKGNKKTSFYNLQTFPSNISHSWRNPATYCLLKQQRISQKNRGILMSLMDQLSFETSKKRRLTFGLQITQIASYRVLT